ncbi:uncharacterized protein HD556DRAFT_1233823 [Suillus plorans]|uniref:F-box domain-containing protein n=1 Tax=Suillus plorans TaxID=116603 RepID=A0A9P7IY46_9AGAM|nr:uncharacterized protein HD556DRAFT_1233823 [Suillus plorans]KAG1797086.1 hypothetical protein HD556DRAFT_1233823 [Suillus plorans]
MSTQAVAFGWLPQEVMENIAFFAATTTDIGPPSDLLPLLLSCRSIYHALSLDANLHLCARIFEYKFDLSAAVRRLGQHIATPDVLSKELRKRFVYLKRIRARTDSRICAPDMSNSPMISELLWLAYLMMLENDGKNVKQLREYAGMEQWLMEYWFDDKGASLASKALLEDVWLLDNEHNSLAMWLFWLFLRPDRFQRTERNYRTFATVLKPTALAANKYNICHTPWEDFIPRSCLLEPTCINHYSNPYQLTPPTMAIPAILSYLSLVGPLVGPARAVYKGLHTPNGFPPSLNQSLEWEADWQRCINLAKSPLASQFSGAYKVGSLQGVWEGVFTYTEFTTYAALLSGRPPSILHNSMVAQHRQTWKLREYYLTVSRGADGIAGGLESLPLSSGDPLKAFFPSGIRIHEHAGSAEVHEPGKIVPLSYRQPSACGVEAEGLDIQDIIVVGEGHSAWGQFNLIGRVRPCDGFVSFLKEYVEGDRGQWLYRGYLVGSINGSLSGRWRDTLSLPDANGYEGCFVMSRRR